MFVPSGSASSLILNEVTLKPVSLFKPKMLVSVVNQARETILSDLSSLVFCHNQHESLEASSRATRYGP